ncbi:DUF2294 family protein [Leptolyngbya cf. ectocarpi LEGE 11479]|uniref:DUF2294 family protein n=1 Tax=Leptolyngbya cf. ectocarpi LEGE 11479 TaxID=1828722 RepID=A0A929FC90_LEPEC|nr:Na-translocating system protein MpsC family protein [Leptolyngbya ectocarpi]MBE9069802.1 DUF2294 family protein [Leptolyngbya cf. ectocarpi LEGE 11479]
MNTTNGNQAIAQKELLESELEALIYQSIGQYPVDVTCSFIGETDLAVLIEDINTPLEAFLVRYCPSELVDSYRQGLHRAIAKRVQRLIEQRVNRSVDEVLTNRQTGKSWMGMFFLHD